MRLTGIRGRVCALLTIVILSTLQLFTSLVDMDDANAAIPVATAEVSGFVETTMYTAGLSVKECYGSECIMTTVQHPFKGDFAVENSTSFDKSRNDNDKCVWHNFTVKGPPYFLTAVFYIRIYKEDKSELKTSDIVSWLEYLRFAGVEHVYVYDNWLNPSEQQREALDIFIKQGYLSYTDWHDHRKPNVWHRSAYQHCIDNHGADTTWQVAIDIDEYPFSSSDTKPGFLIRFIRNFSLAQPLVSEITMQNFLYLGAKDKSRKMLIEQLWRRTHGPANNLVKPIYKPKHIRSAQLHHNKLSRGLSMNAPTDRLRMNHYWGARMQNWGPDTENILKITQEDYGMEPIISILEECNY